MGLGETYRAAVPRPPTADCSRYPYADTEGTLGCVVVCMHTSRSHSTGRNRHDATALIVGAKLPSHPCVTDLEHLEDVPQSSDEVPDRGQTLAANPLGLTMDVSRKTRSRTRNQAKSRMHNAWRFHIVQVLSTDQQKLASPSGHRARGRGTSSVGLQLSSFFLWTKLHSVTLALAFCG
jgi:hypothetical protein